MNFVLAIEMKFCNMVANDRPTRKQLPTALHAHRHPEWIILEHILTMTQPISEEYIAYIKIINRN